MEQCEYMHRSYLWWQSNKKFTNELELRVHRNPVAMDVWAHLRAVSFLLKTETLLIPDTLQTRKQKSSSQDLIIMPYREAQRYRAERMSVSYVTKNRT